MIPLNYLCVFFIILFIHWVADFIFQTHEQAIGQHVQAYTNVWALVGLGFLTYKTIVYHLMLPLIILGVFQVALFCAITFICHFLTDWVTSRLVKYYFDKKNFHNGFVVIGFDQMLHYAQLLFTLYLFTH